jgi:hypothetical protein
VCAALALRHTLLPADTLAAAAAAAPASVDTVSLDGGGDALVRATSPITMLNTSVACTLDIARHANTAIASAICVDLLKRSITSVTTHSNVHTLTWHSCMSRTQPQQQPQLRVHCSPTAMAPQMPP